MNRWARWSLRGLLLVLAVICLGRAFPPPLREGIGVSKAVFDRSEKLMRLTLAPDERYRMWISLEDVAPSVIEATLAEEDRHFYYHPGINPVAMFRGAFHSYVTKSKRMGGSTITMQLARLRYGLQTRTIWGKIKQSVLALRLELGYSKKEIIEAYLNLAPYGLNIEGVGAASLIYFRKPCRKLSVAESLFLVALPQNPSFRSPKKTSNDVLGTGLSYVKHKLVDQWIERHPEQKENRNDLTRALPIFLPKDLPFEAPHFTEDLAANFSTESELHTTLDLAIQRRIKKQIELYIKSKRSKGIFNAAALVVDHRTMEIVASIGSADYFNDDIKGQVNGVKAKRSPGSALKPFVYALAIDQGIIHPLTLLKDTSRRYGILNPENSDNDFMGPVNATNALNLSRNLPALALNEKLHNPDFFDFLGAARIDLPKTREFYGLGLTLGGAEVSMEEMANLYAIFPNKGVLKSLKRLREEPVSPPKMMLSEAASFITQEMLRENVPPGKEVLRRLIDNGEPVAWKTGTSHGFRDAWTAGIKGNYVVVVWVGDFESKSNPAYVGRDTAAPLFFRIVDTLPPSPATFAYLAPRDVTRVRVCDLSGGLPGPYCKHTRETWFIPGKSPVSSCTVHRGILVNNRSGLRSCERYSNEAHIEAFEAWDSDLLRVFRLAGIPRRQIPPLEARCHGMQPAGQPPEITSPSQNLSYVIRLHERTTDSIPLIANVEGGKRSLYWFANEKFLGKVANQEPLFWKASPGKYVLRAIDDFGQSAARELVVSAAE